MGNRAVRKLLFTLALIIIAGAGMTAGCSRPLNKLDIALIDKDLKECSAKAYSDYQAAYEQCRKERPEQLHSVRPLEKEEFKALLLAIEFIKQLRETVPQSDEREQLNRRYKELSRLLKEGRIKYDADPEEAARATQMTTHIPSDPADPRQGDIYIHNEGLLQGVYLPLAGIRKLNGADISEEKKQIKLAKLSSSLFEGVVLLSSYLVHECSHRSQMKSSLDEETASRPEMESYLNEIEDPAYCAQYRYLLVVHHAVADPQLKAIITAMRHTLVREVNARFPDLVEFQKVQQQWD